jgi:hypothetical protein
MRKYVLAALATAAVFAGCKNDFDVMADYKDITLVYGLLNQNDTAHYIKINKAYLGEGNAFLMAGIADSVNYQAADLTVKLEEYNNSTLTNTFPLIRTVNEIAKDTGLFASDANILYKSTATLNPQRRYKLVINNNKTGTTITSETPMIENLVVTNTQNNQQVNIVGNNSFQFTAAFKSAKNALVYSMLIRFKYNEINTVTSQVVTKSIDWTLPNIKSSNTNGGETLQIPLNPDGLFQLLANNLGAPGVNIERQTAGLEFTFYAGGADLSTYLDVNGPSNTLQQEKPEYTNITNGLGIFSSRYNKTVGNITLSPQSLDSLLNGRFTNQLGFTQ